MLITATSNISSNSNVEIPNKNVLLILFFENLPKILNSVDINTQNDLIFTKLFAPFEEGPRQPRMTSRLVG